MKGHIQGQPIILVIKVSIEKYCVRYLFFIRFFSPMIREDNAGDTSSNQKEENTLNKTLIPLVYHSMI